MQHQMKTIAHFCLGASIAVGLSGCLGGESLNTEKAVYLPEERPLNIIAPDDVEVEPGSDVTLTSRLVGTVSGQTVMWQQTAGTTMNLSETASLAVSFSIPDDLLSDTLVFIVTAHNADGSVATDENGDPITDTVEVTVFDPESVISLDVSDSVATLNGVSLIGPSDANYIQGAGNESHTADLEPGMSVTFNVSDAQGFYTLYVRYAIPSDYGGKVGGVSVNGIDYSLDLSATGQWEEIRVGVVELNDGGNSIEIGGGWNYYRIDSISLIPSAEPPPPLAVSEELVNPNASQEAKDLMTFLSENYLTSTLSGQTEFPQKEGDTFPLLETQKIIDATGDDAPAIVAFDYMNYSASYSGSDYTGLTESIIAHHQDQNIIVSALFHWRAPNSSSSFYTDEANFDLTAALADTGSDEYAALIADIDTVASELSKLAEAKIPVLWRPLHEAEGGWFWWGAQGAETFQQLWMLMYDRMTNHHGLNNLIWVFTHTDGLSEDWYPGDSYVDIVGFDGYGDPVNDDTHTFVSQYSTLQSRHNGMKLVALTETGTIPDVSLMHEQGAMWSFFITWNSETWNSDSLIGPQGATVAEIDENYAADGVLNLDDVPSGRTKVSGVYADFEISTNGWEGQANWSPTEGLKVSSVWSTTGANALAMHKDMTTLEATDNIVLQTYPTDGIDVSGVSILTADVHALDAGNAVNAHLFFKAPDGVESWPDAVALDTDGTQLSIDVSNVDMLTGLGVRYQGLDGTQTDAYFLLDNIKLDGVILESFEPDTYGWEAQVNWTGTDGITLSRNWVADGAQSLAFYKDLQSHGSAENIVLQTYPEAGIDVTGINTLTLTAHSENAGNSVDAHIFFKAPDGVESWPAATVLDAEGTQLSIDVSEVNSLTGLGVRFNSVDSSSTDARFYVDNIMLDDLPAYTFESTGNFELQVNWSPVAGLTIGEDWAATGSRSLKGSVNIDDGDEVILQTYPSDGILLADGVGTLSVVAYVTDATETITAKLWAKDQDGNWRDAGAMPVGSDGVELSLDISDLDELQGFGVQFQGLSNSQSNFFIDDISFN